MQALQADWAPAHFNQQLERQQQLRSA